MFLEEEFIMIDDQPTSYVFDSPKGCYDGEEEKHPQQRPTEPFVVVPPQQQHLVTFDQDTLATVLNAVSTASRSNNTPVHSPRHTTTPSHAIVDVPPLPVGSTVPGPGTASPGFLEGTDTGPPTALEVQEVREANALCALSRYVWQISTVVASAIVGIMTFVISSQVNKSVSVSSTGCVCGGTNAPA